MNDKKVIEITLTLHQQDRNDIILNKIYGGTRRIVLTGSAGVGKTTLVNFLIEEFVRAMFDRGLIYIAAPTHKALSVLKTKIAMEEESDPVVFCTIHKGLRLKPKIDKATGRKNFVQSFNRNDPPFSGCKLLVIDEGSMLNQYQLDLLAQYDFPIIFIGDEKQINPVKEIHSPVFHQNWFTIELTEIIRQAEGNPIIELSRDLDKIWIGDEMTVGVASDRTGYLYTNDRPKIIHKLAEVNGTDELKYLAWTNAEVDAINFSVRAEIYGNPSLLEVGESIVLNAPYELDDETFLHNNQEISIKTLEVITKTFYCNNNAFDYKIYLINEEIYAIHEDFIALHHHNVRTIKAMAINKVVEWRQYYAFSEQFLDFKYNHAITIHKSQGSTYKDTIINIQDVASNRNKKEMVRLLYTAVTRASGLVILYNVIKK